MYQKNISTSKSPNIEVTACQGDLTVKAWDNQEVLIEVDSEELLTLEEREDTVALAINGDCTLTTPVNTSLSVIQARDDISVQGLRGSLKVNTLHGDALLRQVGGPVELGAVGGDLVAEEIAGPLSVRSVAGDAYLRQLSGMVYLNEVGGDLIGRNWAAGADVAKVSGDVSLKTVFAGPHSYDIQARGTVVAKPLPGSNAVFTLRATRGRTRAKGLAGELAEDGQWQGTMGNGEAQVSLTSTHGNVLLKAMGEKERAAFSMEFDFGKIGAEVGTAAEELAWRIQQRVAEKLAKIDFESIARREAERVRRQVEREAARAEKIRRKAEKAQRKAQKKARRRFEWDVDRSHQRPSGPLEPSDEEYLAVLKMLAEGKISPQEAEILLEALGG